MWGDKDWDASEATKKANAFKEEQRRLHEGKLARNKAKREADRRAAKIKPPAEYPWLKKD